MLVVWVWDGDGGVFTIVVFFGVVVIVKAAARGAGGDFGEDGLVKGSEGGSGG